jgi:hypothetical protein
MLPIYRRVQYECVDRGHRVELAKTIMFAPQMRHKLLSNWIHENKTLRTMSAAGATHLRRVYQPGSRELGQICRDIGHEVCNEL